MTTSKRRPMSLREEVAAAIDAAVERVTSELERAKLTPLAQCARMSVGPGYYEYLVTEPDPWNLYLEALTSRLPVYGGSACIGISDRARHHESTLTLVRGIDVRHIGVRWVELDPASALAIERRKLEIMRPVWNDGGGLPGFGSRPPGRGRPGVIASWWHSLHRGHPAFEGIPHHRDPDECRARIRAHFGLAADPLTGLSA